MPQSHRDEHIISESDRRRHILWLVGGAWTILSFFMASQFGMHRPNTHWYSVLALELLYSAQWVALFPLGFWLVAHFPFERRKWVVALSVHLIAGVLFSAATMAIRTVLIWLVLDGAQPEFPAGKVVGNLTSALDYGIMSYLLNLLFSYSFVYYEQVRERELRATQLEAELREAQLQALKMHLHPHFLFNTLHAIAVLIRKNEHEVAVEMINRLSKFLRYTLENVSSQEVSLKEEIETIELYLDIQQVRFKDRLSITKQISSDVLDALVPTLILQPLVENALRHGIGSSETAGHLEISAERQNGTIHIHVSDDGPGILVDWRSLQQNGIGLQNTLSRLEKLYGKSFSFDLLNRPDHGTTVALSIPYRCHSVTIHRGT